MPRKLPASFAVLTTSAAEVISLRSRYRLLRHSNDPDRLDWYDAPILWRVVRGKLEGGTKLVGRGAPNWMHQFEILSFVRFESRAPAYAVPSQKLGKLTPEQMVKVTSCVDSVLEGSGLPEKTGAQAGLGVELEGSC